MNIEVPDYSQALTADGGTTGYAVVASTAGFYAGCLGWLRNSDGDATAKRVIITEIKDATHVGVRFIANDNEQQQAMQVYGGRSDLTGFTTAKTSKLYMERQLARVEAAFASLPKPNV
jgi:hypothetical protein